MSIDRIISGLKGYENVTMHFESELRAANRIADGVRDGVIVVVGGFRGQMTCALALHAHVPVYEIDPREGWVGESREFGDVDRPYSMQNILDLGLAERIRPINLPSLDVAKIWDKPISLLFLDGNHTQTSEDLDAWLPHVVDGGIIGFHDVNGPDILRAITSCDQIVEFERANISAFFHKEPLYEQYTYDDITMWVRKGPYNKDDRYVLGEVRSYAIGDDPVRTCIDVGAQIGAFTCWIKSRNPDAKIVAIEPEMSGYRALLKNTEHLRGVTTLNARVNYDDGEKFLFVDPVNAGSHRVIDNAPPGAPVVVAPAAVTLEEIMRDQYWDTLDLLKVDCEGAEADIFANCSDAFLRKVKRIVGEFHTNFGSPMEPIVARLEALDFAVTWETNPAAHATFVAVQLNWTEPEPIEFGTVVTPPAKKAKVKR